MTLVFGYGSLMLPKARSGLVAAVSVKGRLRGYRRGFCVQCEEDGKKMTDMAVYDWPVGEVLGCVLEVTPEQLAKLDKREDGYKRENEQLNDGRKAWTYCIEEDDRDEPDEDYPVYVSYLAAVVLGAYDLAQAEGVRNLIDSADTWRIPMLDDSDGPRHPKAINLRPADIDAARDIARRYRELRHLLARRPVGSEGRF